MVDAAFDDDAARAVKASVETATALKTLATRVTGNRIKTFTSLTVPVTPSPQDARTPDLVRSGLDFD
jgi:hypothetical protein